MAKILLVFIVSQQGLDLKQISTKSGVNDPKTVREACDLFASPDYGWLVVQTGERGRKIYMPSSALLTGMEQAYFEPPQDELSDVVVIDSVTLEGDQVGENPSPALPESIPAEEKSLSLRENPSPGEQDDSQKTWTDEGKSLTWNEKPGQMRENPSPDSLKYLRSEGGGDDLNSTPSPPPDFKGHWLAENRQLLEHSDLLFGEPGVLVDKLDQAFLDTIPPEIVRGWLNQAYFLRSKNRLTSPAGYVFAALQKYPEEKPKDKFRHAAADAFLPGEYLVEIGVKESSEGESAGDTQPESVPLEADETVTERVEQIWESVIAEIRKDMPKAQFDTWVRDTYPVRHVDNCLSVAVRNAYARDWLTSRLKSTCERLLGGISVEFVVAP